MELAQRAAADWQMIGSIADWSTAGVALFAFVAAAFAARATLQTNRAQQEALELQRKQYEELQNQMQRAQAEKVTVWQDWDVQKFKIINASDSPIYELVLALAVDEAFPYKLGFEQRVVLPTGSKPIGFDADNREIWDAVTYSLDLYFRDASGLYWKRSEFGELDQLDSDEFNSIYEDLVLRDDPHKRANRRTGSDQERKL
jgi:type II secretory pathway pseudopilin PulG